VIEDRHGGYGKESKGDMESRARQARVAGKGDRQGRQAKEAWGRAMQARSARTQGGLIRKKCSTSKGLEGYHCRVGGEVAHTVHSGFPEGVKSVSMVIRKTAKRVRCGFLRRYGDYRFLVFHATCVYGSTVPVEEISP
jgi:hypothetical protein